jgi:hypothetical protein
MTDLEAEIVQHRQKATGRVAGTEITVDVGPCQPGVFQRTFGDLGVKLCGGFIGCVPGRMFVNSGNVSFAPDGQAVLRWRFLLPSVFSLFGSTLASADIFRRAGWASQREVGAPTFWA